MLRRRPAASGPSTRKRRDSGAAYCSSRPGAVAALRGPDALGRAAEPQRWRRPGRRRGANRGHRSVEQRLERVVAGPPSSSTAPASRSGAARASRRGTTGPRTSASARCAARTPAAQVRGGPARGDRPCPRRAPPEPEPGVELPRQYGSSSWAASTGVDAQGEQVAPALARPAVEHVDDRQIATSPRPGAATPRRRARRRGAPPRAGGCAARGRTCRPGCSVTGAPPPRAGRARCPVGRHRREVVRRHGAREAAIAPRRAGRSARRPPAPRERAGGRASQAAAGDRGAARAPHIGEAGGGEQVAQLLGVELLDVEGVEWLLAAARVRASTGRFGVVTTSGPAGSQRARRRAGSRAGPTGARRPAGTATRSTDAEATAARPGSRGPPRPAGTRSRRARHVGGVVLERDHVARPGAPQQRGAVALAAAGLEDDASRSASASAVAIQPYAASCRANQYSSPRRPGACARR